MSSESILSALGLPSELLDILSQIGIDIDSLVLEPEHRYILQLTEYVEGLPDQVRQPVNVLDPGAFAAFLGDSGRSYFMKFLALHNLNNVLCFQPELRFKPEHYVSSIASLITRPDVPMYIVTKCYTILVLFEQIGENIYSELCKTPSLPAALASFIERVCDDPVARLSIDDPETSPPRALICFVEDFIKLLCTIIMKACTTGKLKPPATSDPEFCHAQTLRSICIRLLARFKPHPLAAASQAAGDAGNSVAGEGDGVQDMSLLLSPKADNALELLWAIGCLVASDVPFPQADCRVFFNDLLRYIETEKDCRIMHAIVGCVSVTLPKLHALPSAGPSSLNPQAFQELQTEKQRVTSSLTSLLLLHPCELGKPGEQQPIDYCGDLQGLRQQRRRLVGPLSSLQRCTLFDMSLQIINDCIDTVEMAAYCVSFEKGALLSIVSKKLQDSTRSQDVTQHIELIETLTDLLCNSKLRHVVAAGGAFPPDLVEPLHEAMKSQRLRQFFEEKCSSHKHANSLHGGMVVPARGDCSSATLKQIANYQESGGITVLAYAAATNLRDAVRLLLRLGADPDATGSCGKNAMQMSIEHNSNSSQMLELLKSVKELQVVSVKECSKDDHELCKRVTGKSASDFVSLIWENLLDAATATPHSEICFSILTSLFNTISCVHPAILENLLISLIPVNSDKSPKSTSALADTPSSFTDASVPGFKIRASSLSERLFKLMKTTAKRFSRSSGIDFYVLTALNAVMILLKLPTSRPLARLCHKHRLLDLAELVHVPEAGCTPVVLSNPGEIFGGDDDEGEGEGEEDEGEGDDGEEDPVAHLHRMRDRAIRRLQALERASVGKGSGSSSGCVVDFSQIKQLLSELGAALDAHDFSSAEDSNACILVTISHSLTAAVFGSTVSPSTSTNTVSVTDALKSLFEFSKDFTISDHFDSPQGYAAIKALCTFLNSEQPSPAPDGSISKALRRSIFRDIACPSVAACSGLKALIHHIETVFEDNQSDILALLGSKPMIPASFRLSSFFGDSTKLVHLIPIESDNGCSEHFGSTRSSFRYSSRFDLRGVADSLNSKRPIEHDLPSFEAPSPPQLRRFDGSGGDESGRRDWKDFDVSLSPPQDAFFDSANSEGYGFRFKAAVPCAEFIAFQTKKDKDKAPKQKGGAANALQFKGMSYSQKKRAKRRAKQARDAALGISAEESEDQVFLKPNDIARVRLFLCLHADVKGGQLPSKHMEINPLQPLSESVSEFLNKFPDHKSAAPSFSSPFGVADQGSEQAVAIFYGSGGEFSQLCIPDELRWRIETLGLQVECGHVLLLDVVAAIKSAMPPDWLSEHKMDADCSSIVFSMSTREILDVYASALRAWGAENPIGPGIDDSILSSGSISVESISATAFDVPKTISQPNGRGFRFSENDSQVSYPNGPISLFTQAVVGPHTPLKFAHFSFKYLGGNDAWSVGVIPESQSENPEVLWRSRDAIGRVNGSHGSHLRSFQPNRGDTLASCIDAVQSVWFLSVNGAVVAREHIPPNYFPVRLGFCGHNGSTFQLIPGAEVPPEILGQCKMSIAVNNASKWQWIRDDGSWVSYDTHHAISLEKAYGRFISRADKPSRAFIEARDGHTTLRYQFDFHEPTAAPQVAPDAPDEHPVCCIVGTQTNLISMRTREVRRCIPSSPPASQSTNSKSHAPDDTFRAELALEAMQLLLRELELCVMSMPPLDGVPDISIDELSGLQSSLLSVTYQASKSSESRAWNQLASHVPLLLDYKTRLSAFRKSSCTKAEQLENMTKDRVNGVERDRILEWSAAITAAQLKQGRRNPVMISFITDGVRDGGYGQAITNEFFCNVAEAFSLADTGMWIINDEDVESWRVSSSGPADVHRPLAAQNGLFFQPYCSSAPMPPELLRRFKLLGTMMAKALHDGRVFPMRISYAVARCICGQVLEFDDLSSILSFHFFKTLQRIRSSGCGWDGLVFACPAQMAEQGRIVARQLELVPGGEDIEVTAANASEYLRAIERMYLGDGVLQQIRALQSGFYSIISQENVAILGPSGLLEHMGALRCPEFDREDMLIGLKPENGYTTESPQYIWLIEALLSFDEPQRRATIQFITGSPVLPSGFQGLPVRITVQMLMTDECQPCGDSHFPKCQTCAGLFKLPRYSSAERLREKLLIAIFIKYMHAFVLCFAPLTLTPIC